jgi:hypothetical protein
MAVLDGRDVGIAAEGAGTRLTLAGSMVARTAPREVDGLADLGVQATKGARLELDRCAVVDNVEGGVVASAPDTNVVMSRTLVASTRPRQGSGLLGRGLSVQREASLSATASALIGNHEIAAAVVGAGARLELTGSSIAGTLPDGAGAYGIGVNCSGGALVVASTLIRGSHTTGILAANGFAEDPCTATLDGVLVDGVLPGSFNTFDALDKTTITGTFDGIADGIVSAFGATSNMTRIDVRGAERAALVFDSSVGALTHVSAAGGRFGLVVQSSPGLTWDERTTTFVGGDESIVRDAMLPVPGPPQVQTE